MGPSSNVTRVKVNPGQTFGGNVSYGVLSFFFGGGWFTLECLGVTFIVSYIVKQVMMSLELPITVEIPVTV